jgi:competence protein ComEC
MFLVGWVLTGKAWGDVKVEWPAERQVYRGVVKERPVEKKRTYQCRVEVADRDILLYLPKDSASASLGVADELLFEARIDSPKEENDSLDFDSATYLYHHGISGTAYVQAHAWLNKGQVKDKSWRQEALLVRERLLDKFQAWGVEAERMPVLAALTLGHKGDLDKETRTSFSLLFP